MPQEQSPLPRGRRAKPFGPFLVYLLVTALVVGVWAGCMGWVYPRMLTFSAPDVSGSLPEFVADRLPNMTLDGLSGAARYEVYRVRDTVWQGVVTAVQGAYLVLTLLLALGWRHRAARIRLPHVQGVRRAVVGSKVNELLLLLLGIGASFLLWHIGLRGRTDDGLWDHVVLYAPVLATWLAGHALYRFAAPGVISGRHGYFVRLRF